MISNLILIIHLTGQGKLDRLDHQIMAIQSSDYPIGYKRIAAILKKPVSTIQGRIKKIRALMDQS